MMSHQTLNSQHNIATLTINPGGNSGDYSDDLSEPSSPESATFDASDLLNTTSDDITAQLAAAGPVGVAAAAAIASCKKRKHPHHFETNPSKRKRQQTRLLRKLRQTIEEYTTRVGQQAVVLFCTPGKSTQIGGGSYYKVFGTQPLENVIRNCRGVIMHDLETALQEQTPASQQDNSHLHELPPLVIDGIPTPVDKMTQAQLRNFIPEMLKYSTGRSKPGWGKGECRPIWWPSDLPWANVRSDARTDEEKKRVNVTWTDALRAIVKNCYKHHGREDLLHVFNDDSNTSQQLQVQQSQQYGTMVQTINNPDGTLSIIQIDTGGHGNQIVTLPDGTQATVVHAQVQDGGQQEASQAVQTLAEVAVNNQPQPGLHVTPVSVEMNDNQQSSIATLQGATINSQGQIILSQDGTLGSLVTIPVSVYQAVTAQANQMNQAVTSNQINQVAVPNHITLQDSQISNGLQLVTQSNEVTMTTTNEVTVLPDIKQEIQSVQSVGPDQAVEVMAVNDGSNPAAT